jgi:hypothetical protein
MNRGEWGVSEEEVLLTRSMAVRIIRVSRRAHVGQWSPVVYSDY